MNALTELILKVDARFLEGCKPEETRVAVEITGEEWSRIRDAALSRNERGTELFPKGLG